ncbi:MAG: DUF5606 domain-containing protein [Bacteroidota bacterium]
MNLDNLIAVGGLPSLYRMVANRSNGLIIEDLETGKKRFASSRKHQFTPLGSIAIFTDDGDSVALASVFRNMRDQFDDQPPVDPSASTEGLYEYFTDILPNYDQERVYPGDIKKIIKWFNILNSNELLADAEEEE